MLQELREPRVIGLAVAAFQPGDRLHHDEEPAKAAPSAPINARAEAQVGNPTNVLFSVPAGSLLVIENASLNAGILDEQETVTASITTTVDGVEAQHFVGAVSAPSRIGGAATAMRAYSDPGTDVTVQRGTAIPTSPAR